MSIRVLVQRPHRKLHLATVDGPGFAVSYCDRIIDLDGADVDTYSPAGGATKRLVEELKALVGQRDICAHCSRFVMLIALLESDRWLAASER
jgi:hypothetical protein